MDGDMSVMVRRLNKKRRKLMEIKDEMRDKDRRSKEMKEMLDGVEMMLKNKELVKNERDHIVPTSKKHIEHVDDSDDDPDDVEEVMESIRIRAERKLSMLSSTDWGKDGMNEVGLKIAVLFSLPDGAKVTSERTVEGGYIDLLIDLGSFLVILELKCLRVWYWKSATSFDGIGLREERRPIQLRRSLIKCEQDLRRMDEDLLLEEMWMTYYKSESRECKVRQFMEDAMEQCRQYHRSLIKGNINPMRIKDKPIYRVVLLGIGSRLMIDIDLDQTLDQQT